MNKELIESIAALMENVTSDYRQGFIQGAHWANQPVQRTEQEPWCMKMNNCKTKCEDCPDEPPQRTWVGLTDEDCKDMSAGDRVVAMWANRTLKEKNT